MGGQDIYIAFLWFIIAGPFLVPLLYNLIQRPQHKSVNLISEEAPLGPTTYGFRIRFTLAGDCRIGHDLSSLKLSCDEEGKEISVANCGSEEPLSAARKIVLRGSAWQTEHEARQAGERYLTALRLTLIKMQMGADFGGRTSQSVITDHGLKMLEKQTGHRILREIDGINVFETKPEPKFASFGPVNAFVTRNVAGFTANFSEFVSRRSGFDDAERLSAELYLASYFETSIDAQFLTLVMAIEAMLRPPARSANAVQHVDELIALTKSSSSVSGDDKNSLLGSLKWLRQESINHTGRMLAATRLGDRKYLDRPAPKFFSHCYNLRSRLVHGATDRPSRQDVASANSELRRFVSDLICSAHISEGSSKAPKEFIFEAFDAVMD